METCVVNVPYRCMCCGIAAGPEVIFHSKDKSLAGDIVRCPGCKLTYVNPLPSETVIARSYVGLYEELSAQFDEQKMRWARTSMKGYIRELESLGQWPKRSFLDVGGGLGYYARAAQEESLSSTLIDWDPVSVTFAKKLGVSDAYQMSIEEFASTVKGRKYDLIFLRHVIEHCKSPESLIMTINSLLSEDGVLVVETPNNAGIEVFFKLATCRYFVDFYKKLYKGVSWFSVIYKKPYAVRPPKHLFAFRVENLEMLLGKHGLVSIKSLNYMMGDEIYWPNVQDSSLKDIFFHFRRRYYARFVQSGLDFCLRLTRQILHKHGNSSGICIYAVKSNRIAQRQRV